jgi:hypothetical protein
MMALKKRERILVIATGTLVLLWLVVTLLFSGLSSPFGSLHASRANLAEEVEKKKNQVQKGREAEARLDQWRRRALPSDPNAAKSLYQNWLLELAVRKGVRGARVEPTATRQRRGIYLSLAFSVQGQAELDELTRLLYDFYSAGHLHQIRRLSIKPLEGSREFDLFLLVEALSLPDADRNNELTEESSDRLAAGDLETYRKVIVDRNLFAPYSPPPPPVVRTEPREPPPPPPSFDHAKHTYVTGITAVDGIPQVWIQIRTKGQSLRLREGDRFEVGSLEGTVVRIGTREVVIELGDERLLAFQGQSLRDGLPLDDEEETAMK